MKEEEEVFFEEDETNNVPEVFSANEAELAELAGAEEEDCTFTSENPEYFWKQASEKEIMHFLETGADFKDEGREHEFFKSGQIKYIKKYISGRIKNKRVITHLCMKKIFEINSRSITKQLDCAGYFKSKTFCTTFIEVCAKKKFLSAHTNVMLARFFIAAPEKFAKQLLNLYLTEGLNIPADAQVRLALSLKLDYVRSYISSYLEKGLDLKTGFDTVLLGSTSVARRKAFFEAWLQNGKTLTCKQQNALVLLDSDGDDDIKNLMFQNIQNGGMLNCSPTVVRWMFDLEDDEFILQCIEQNHKNGFYGDEKIDKLLFIISTNNIVGKEFHKKKREKFIKALLG